MNTSEYLIAGFDAHVLDVGLEDVIWRPIYLRCEPLVPRDVGRRTVGANGLLDARLENVIGTVRPVDSYPGGRVPAAVSPGRSRGNAHARHPPDANGVRPGPRDSAAGPVVRRERGVCDPLRRRQLMRDAYLWHEMRDDACVIWPFSTEQSPTQRRYAYVSMIQRTEQFARNGFRVT